ncbi:hypothetical protein BKA65DRAFT_602189 [Rhexocercosporidium sp. MPI-PUGE-AT-0058]|nr:hypothetical protein BKA65DRAFT_602189 [Rhexocercosporidium sp. MPI-PUGE-AT-0058]
MEPTPSGRSRGGCSNCRRRKRKCDETHPGCRACQRRGIQCTGYNTTIRWANGIASRGRFAGAATPNLAASGGSDPSPKALSSLPSHPTTIDEPQARVSSSSPILGDAEGLDLPGFAVHQASPESQSATSSLATLPASGISASNQQLFQRCIHAGMNRFFLSESYTWPKAHFVAMAERSEAFFAVCVAIQAYLEDGFSVSSMEHVDYALNTFRSELESRHKSFDVSTLSAGLLVCSLCLLQGKPWTMFLGLMYDLYDLGTSMGRLLPTANHDLAICHSIEVLSIMDMEPMVIGRENPSMGIWRRLRKVQEGWEGGKLGGVEIVTGIPRTFLDIIADIGNDDAQDVESRLWAWPGEVGLNAQCLLWDCWRYTAVLDVRRVERKKRKMKANVEAMECEVETGKMASFPSRDVVMCRLATSVDALRRTIEMPTKHDLAVRNGLMYPLIVGSLEVPLLAAHPERKQVFDDLRARILERDTSRNVRLVDEVLNEAWNEGTDMFNINEAARKRGIEIAIF